MRAVILSLGDVQGWRNVVTVLRFSEMTRDEVEQSHRDLVRALGLTDDLMTTKLGREHLVRPYVGFNIDLSASDASGAELITDQLERGSISTPTRAIYLTDNTGVPLQDTEPVLIPGRFIPARSEWPRFYYWRWGNKATVLNERGLDRQLDSQSRQARFRNFGSMTEEVVGVPWHAGGALEMHLPVYARLTGVESSPTTVTIGGIAHRALLPLTVEARMMSYEHSGPERQGPLMRQEIPAAGGEGSYQTFSCAFDVTDRPNVGQLDVALFKQGPTRVELGDAKVPLSSSAPLFNAYTAFVPEADLTQYLEALVAGQNINQCTLFKRYKARVTSKKAAELLEYVTAHLMGLCELNPITLSNPQYDAVSGDVAAGGADLLGLGDAGRPMLVSCTMGMPDGRKRGLLSSACAAIARRSGLSAATFVLVLVTGKPTAPNVDDDIHDVSAQDLERAWQMIQEGDISQARRVFGLQQPGLPF